MHQKPPRNREAFDQRCNPQITLRTSSTVVLPHRDKALSTSLKRCKYLQRAFQISATKWAQTSFRCSGAKYTCTVITEALVATWNHSSQRSCGMAHNTLRAIYLRQASNLLQSVTSFLVAFCQWNLAETVFASADVPPALLWPLLHTGNRFVAKSRLKQSF